MRIQKSWIKEALRELDSYNSEPFVDRFMSKHGLDPNISKAKKRKFRSKKQKLQRIRYCILAKNHQLKFSDLVNYLDDELKLSGRQVIFLWYLKKGEEKYLSKLRDQNHIEHLLKAHGLENRWNKRKLIWKSDTPELAEVRYVRTGDKESLRFKWVTTRHYFVREKNPNSVNPPFILVPKTQRAVTFFDIDLKNGDSELRIQQLPPGITGLGNLKKEFEMYKAKIEKLVELGRFAPVVVEPVAKHFLREPILPITRWSVLRPDSAPMDGGERGGRMLPKPLLTMQEFFARRATIKWNCEQEANKSPLYFTLDGRNDSVEFGGIDDASRIDFVLDKIRHYASPVIQIPELRKLSEEYPEYSRIISSVDYQFTKLMKLRVSAEDLSKKLWYSEETVLKVFQLAARKFSKIFSIPKKEENVLVMSNKLRLNGGIVDKLTRSAVQKGKHIKKALVKPVATIGYILLNFLSERLSSWVLSSFFRWLTGAPFIVVDVLLVLSIALLYAIPIYGKKSVGTVLTRVPKGVFIILRYLVLSLPRRQLLKAVEVVEEEYNGWKKTKESNRKDSAKAVLSSPQDSAKAVPASPPNEAFISFYYYLFLSLLRKNRNNKYKKNR